MNGRKFSKTKLYWIFLNWEKIRFSVKFLSFLFRFKIKYIYNSFSPDWWQRLGKAISFHPFYLFLNLAWCFRSWNSYCGFPFSCKQNNHQINAKKYNIRNGMWNCYHQKYFTENRSFQTKSSLFLILACPKLVETG